MSQAKLIAICFLAGVLVGEACLLWPTPTSADANPVGPPIDSYRCYGGFWDHNNHDCSAREI